MKRMAVFSMEADLHAHALVHTMRARADAECHFISTDTLALSGGMCWRQGARGETRLLSRDEQWVDLAGLDLVWWRRIGMPQLLEEDCVDPATRPLIDNEWRSALTGAVRDSFKGVWVNEPARDALAGNKLVQLNAAAECGLRVPRTLVSQDPEEIRRFCESAGGTIVVKKLIGAPPAPLAALSVTLDDLQNDASLRLCPAIYQEQIAGGRHIRANCFGTNVFSVLIESPLLDWRRDLSVRFSPYTLDDRTEAQLIMLLKRLGIEMGILDLILGRDGEVTWLELNTQGQFLFCEALAGIDLMNPFAEFLMERMDAIRSTDVPR